MGFLDKIRRKKQKDANLVKSKNEEFVEKKESDNLNRVCIKFSIEFKNKYESINEYTKNEHENLLELLNTWRNKCPNDANSSLAYVILHSENDSLISINELESVYLKATDELQPLNPLLYEWFRNKAEISLKNKKYKIQIKSKINEGLIENESCHQILFKNFKYLDDLIHSGKKEISLDYDIRLDTDESYQYINIEENNIVIDGNGHSIDACERGRIFDCSGKNITIKNIIFQNSKGAISASNTITFINCCFHNNAGGRSSAITSSSSCLTFVNCDFNNNSAQLGGAIYLAPESFSYFENCNFYNNWAESVNKNVGWNSYDDQGNYGGHGGAIYCLGNIKLDNCLFDNNHADILGGAIFLKDYKASAELHECKFLRNYSYKMGGAIYNKMNSYLNNCYFENNQISYDYFFNNLSYGSFNANLSYEIRLLGGAICSFREIIIENSKFKSNQADYGGAISNLYEMSLDDCLFENNEANNDGGAIINLTTKSFTKYLNIEMCNFINNIAKNQGDPFSMKTAVIKFYALTLHSKIMLI